MRGRKSIKEEIRVVQYMAELAPKTFRVISEMMESDEKADRKWAVEQMSKLYTKAIPQEISGDPEAPVFIQIAREIADKNDIHETDTSTVDNSEGSTQISGS